MELNAIRRLKNLKHFIEATLAVIRYGYPARRLKVIGVTGTDGKTTTVHLIQNILKITGERSAFISSVTAKIGDKEIDTGFHVTTPNPWLLQKLLRQMVDKKVDYVVLEATSHGLDQHRLLGCNFQVGVVTNVTHEHLDYHRTYKNYLRAKGKLFRGVKVAVLNQEDDSFNYLKSKVPKKAKIISYGLKKGSLTPNSFNFKTKLLGEYNQYNCLAAVGVAKSLGIGDKYIRQTLLSFPGVIGRLEEINMGQPFKAFVDFAHTPNGLEQTLKTLKIFKPKKLIAVFGCAGERDAKSDR